MAEALTQKSLCEADCGGPCSGACAAPELVVEDRFQSAAYLSVVLEIIPDWVIIVDRAGLIVDCRAPAPDEIKGPTYIGQDFHDILPPDAIRQTAYYLDKAFTTGQPQNFTFSWAFENGQKEFRAHIADICGKEAVVLLRDVTSERLREKEILEITTREQTRIGQDLHDGLGQQLTGISFLSRALEQRLAARNIPEAAEVAEISRLVLQTLSQTRNLARGLFPVDVESHGLIPALKQLGLEAEKLFDIRCAVNCEAEFAVQDHPTVTHLFRLAQEAISNSVKHGKAKQVAVRLERVNGTWALSISDDGIGIRENQGGNGLGMRIMNYRAQKIGGTLDVISKPSGGVQVRCTFPVPASTAVN